VISQYVNTLSVRSSMTQDNIKGESAIFFCTWTADDTENPDELIVSLSGQDYLIKCGISHFPYNCTAKNNYELSNSARGLVSMSINGLSCSNQGKYFCSILEHSDELKQEKSASFLNFTK
ncbi:hypothetical protein BgiMline_031804, partial [Biomphalaria glabrata]